MASTTQEKKVLDLGVFATPAHSLVANPSPFCVKLELYCKAAGVPYAKPELKAGDMGPRGKLPYATFAATGDVVPDSAAIIEKLNALGYSLDAGLTEDERVQARLIAALCEDSLYFVMVYLAWQRAENWPSTKAEYFAGVPWLLRGFISRGARKGVVNALKGQGCGRRPVEEAMALGTQAVDDLAALLGEKKTFFGTPKLTTADVIVFAQLDHLLYGGLPYNPLADHIRTKTNLVAFLDGIAATHFPDVAKARVAAAKGARE